jgi:hypothetical protein
LSNPLFTAQFKGSINEEAIREVAEQLKSERILTIKDVSFGAYFNGLRAYSNCENGLYFFRFEDDSYYIGLASSCTFMERLSKHVDGSLLNVGVYGYCWSSTVSGTYSRYLFFFSSSAYMSDVIRAFGFSVRCLKD